MEGIFLLFGVIPFFEKYSISVFKNSLFVSFSLSPEAYKLKYFS